MSTSGLTIWAAVVAGAAVLLLVVLDHRTPDRRRSAAPRAGVLGARRSPTTVEHLPAQPYKRTPLWRRFLAAVGLGASGLIVGALVATVLAAVIITLFLLIESAVK